MQDNNQMQNGQVNNVQTQSSQVQNVNNVPISNEDLTAELERLRKTYANRLIVIIILFIFFFMTMMFFTFISIIIMIVAVILMFTYVGPAKKAFESKYKNHVVLSAFNKMFTDVSYNYEMGISEQTIRQTGMMRMGNRYYSNDYLKGKYKDINFESADVEIQEESTDSDGNTTTTTLFKGQWFIFDFNKTFKADIQVCQKSFHNAKRKGGLFTKEEEKFKKVELEDMEFNKVFNVYAQNSVEAFYILTPNTMQKIKDLDNQIRGALLFCFINNKLHVGISSGKDLFEPKVFKPINLQEAEQQILTEIRDITQFVDILNLDNTLFKQ